MDQRYLSGEDIHIGDRVEYGGRPSTIVFVVDIDQWPDNESMERRAWWRAEHGSGFLLLQDVGERIFFPKADEHLVFVSRAPNAA
jgi:hypothetical protein